MPKPSPIPRSKLSLYVLTGAVAAITATGTWYGAGLKVRQELKQEVKALQEASPDEMIAQLEQARAGLVAKRVALERKVRELEARRQTAPLK